MKKIRVYIGHKLTRADPKFLERMDAVRSHAEQALADTCEFMKFLGTKDGTCLDVFDKDIDDNVRNCDLFVCVVDHDSTGLGMEIGAALWKSGKPALLVRTMGMNVSRLPLGAVARYPQQIMETIMTDVPGIDCTDLVTFIKEAISTYRLDSPEPVRFPSLEDLCRQAGIFIGIPLERGWKS